MSINIRVYFCQNEIKLCITISMWSHKDFFGMSRENTLSGLPEAFFDEKPSRAAGKYSPRNYKKSLWLPCEVVINSYYQIRITYLNDLITKQNTNYVNFYICLFFNVQVQNNEVWSFSYFIIISVSTVKAVPCVCVGNQFEDVIGL